MKAWHMGWCPYHGGYIGFFCTFAQPGRPMCCYSSKIGGRAADSAEGGK